MMNPHSNVIQQVVKTVVEPPPKEDESNVATELTQAIGKTNDVLIRATTVFPFTLFPDTIALDRTQLSVTKRDIFKAGEVFSIRVEDILNITASVDLFFGTIKIATRFFDPGKPYTIKFLKRSDALRIKRIVQGYLIARQRNIDCTALEASELAKMLDELGQVHNEEKI